MELLVGAARTSQSGQADETWIDLVATGTTEATQPGRCTHDGAVTAPEVDQMLLGSRCISQILHTATAAEQGIQLLIGSSNKWRAAVEYCREKDECSWFGSQAYFYSVNTSIFT